MKATFGYILIIFGIIIGVLATLGFAATGLFMLGEISLTFSPLLIGIGLIKNNRNLIIFGILLIGLILLEPLYNLQAKRQMVSGR